MKIQFSTDLEEIASMPPVPKILHLILLELVLGSKERPPMYEKLHIDFSDLYSEKSHDCKSLRLKKEIHGRMVEDPANSSGSLTLAFESYTEIEFVFQAKSNAIDGADYCFRLTNLGSAFEEYSVYPELQIASP